MQRPALSLLALLLLSVPASAREALGMFNSWGAFRDAAIPRCYAIAIPQSSSPHRDTQPYADVGTWPQRPLRGAVHFRLSRRIAPGTRVTLSIAGTRLPLVASPQDAWPPTPRDDAAITAAMRSAETMTLSARDTSGKSFTDTYPLSGAATAMDAAALGCATR